MSNHDGLLLKVFFDDKGRMTSKSIKFHYQYSHHRKYCNIYEYLTTRYDDLTLNSNTICKEALYRILRHIEKRTKCPICGKYTSFNPIKLSCYNDHCSKSCALKDSNVHEKQDKTKIERYGSKVNINKRKKTCLEKYGVDNPSKASQTKEKAKQTNIERYNMSCPLQNEEVKKKSKLTNVKKYGTQFPQANEDIKDKIAKSNEKTCMMKYGVKNIAKLESTTSKRKQTCIAKYGYDNIVKAQKAKSELFESLIDAYGLEWFDKNKGNKEELLIKLTRLNKNTNLLGISTIEESRQKSKETCIRNYGVDNPMKSEKTKEKIKEILKEKYGYGYWSQNPENKILLSYIMSSDDTQKKIKNTCVGKYGVDNPLKSKKIQDKIREKSREKYGYDFWVQNPENRLLLSNIMSSKEIQEKINNTKRLHNSFNSSIPEDYSYELIKKRYPDVLRQYKSEKYPFNCDFYIPSLDLYIECQYGEFHNKRPYIGDERDLKEIDELRRKSQIVKEKTGRKRTRYDAVIETWTNRDPKKRKIAKQNNLNFKELWTMKEAKEYIENL